MMSEDLNQGKLEQNNDTQQTKGNRPALTGDLNLGLNGKVKVAAWKKTSRKGTEYFEVSLYKKEPTDTDPYNQRRVGTGRLFPE